LSQRQASYYAIVSDLYAGTLDDVAWDRGLMAFAKLVNGEGPYLASINPQTMQLLRQHIYSYDPSVIETYSSQWLAHDERYPAGLVFPEGEPFTEAKAMPRKSWEQTPIFNEFLSDVDAPWFLCTFLHKSRCRTTNVSIEASRDRGPFSAEDIERVRPIIPHIRRAMEIKDRLEMQGLRGDALAHCLDKLPFGVMLLDEHNRVQEASSAAQQSLMNAGALTYTHDGLLMLREPAQGQLCKLLASRLRRGEMIDGLLRIDRGPLRAPLSLLVAPLPQHLHSWISRDAHWLVLVFDPERGIAPAIEIVACDLGLSPREAEISLLLAMGLGTHEVAQRLAVKLTTVRTHLKAIMNKTGAGAQMDIVRRVVTGPAWALLKRS